MPIWKKEHFEGGEVWIGSQKGQAFPPAAPKADRQIIRVDHGSKISARPPNRPTGDA